MSSATVLNTQGRTLAFLLRGCVWMPGSHRLRVMTRFAVLVLIEVCVTVLPPVCLSVLFCKMGTSKSAFVVWYNHAQQHVSPQRPSEIVITVWRVGPGLTWTPALHSIFLDLCRGSGENSGWKMATGYLTVRSYHRPQITECPVTGPQQATWPFAAVLDTRPGPWSVSDQISPFSETEKNHGTVGSSSYRYI